MSKYTIADRLMSGENPVMGNGHRYPASLDSQIGFYRTILKSTIRVQANEPAHWYYTENESTNWSLGSPVYGPLRLPFDDVWIEWDATPKYFAGGKLGDNPFLGGGALINETDKVEFIENQTSLISDDCRLRILEQIKERFERAEKVLRVEHFIIYKSLPGLIVKGGRSIIGITESGEFVDHVVTNSALEFAGQDPGLALANAEHFRPALMAIGLMNCKNVALELVKAAPIRKGKKARNQIPTLSFHTIKLPGGNTSSQGGVGVDGKPVAFHKVRGHFKTFTEDAPLLGKVTGTYWWGWQSRGKKSNGIVLKDYEVSQSTELVSAS
jgi:hypothetical protein